MPDLPFSAPGLPLPHELAENSGWQAVLLARVQAMGCEVEAADDALRVASRCRPGRRIVPLTGESYRRPAQEALHEA